MNTKEAIKFLEYIITIAGERYNEDSIKKKDKIIGLLQRGEKYEAIVKEIDETLPKPHYVYKNCRGKEFAHYCNANAIEIINNIKQKYFPK